MRIQQYLNQLVDDDCVKKFHLDTIDDVRDWQKNKLSQPEKKDIKNS